MTAHRWAYLFKKPKRPRHLRRKIMRLIVARELAMIVKASECKEK